MSIVYVIKSRINADQRNEGYVLTEEEAEKYCFIKNKEKKYERDNMKGFHYYYGDEFYFEELPIIDLDVANTRSKNLYFPTHTAKVLSYSELMKLAKNVNHEGSLVFEKIYFTQRMKTTCDKTLDLIIYDNDNHIYKNKDFNFQSEWLTDIKPITIPKKLNILILDADYNLKHIVANIFEIVNVRGAYHANDGTATYIVSISDEHKILLKGDTNIIYSTTLPVPELTKLFVSLLKESYRNDYDDKMNKTNNMKEA